MSTLGRERPAARRLQVDDPDDMAVALNYNNYLRLSRLLSAQVPLSAMMGHRTRSAEHFFIIVHQTSELWLKQASLDIDLAREVMRGAGDGLSDAADHLARAAMCVDQMTSAAAALDLLDVTEFNRFRSLLGNASGMQSQQTHALMNELGLPTGGSPLLDEYLELLHRRGVTLWEVCGTGGGDDLGSVADRLAELAVAMYRWQATHLRIVRKMIEDAPGTGGTTGAGYLHKRLELAFPALWRARRDGREDVSPGLPPTMSTAGVEVVDPVALVRSALERCGQHAGLRAFVELDERTALVEAGRAGGTGPLAGMVLAVKDNIDVRGWPTTAGTPSLRDNRPDRDAPVVASLRQAGALVLGKANMHELAYGVTSDNGAFGRVGNPVDPARIAGGSSGGTAAAVAAGLVTAGLGTETGCSVRVPAALCGVVGFRPTTGRYSSDGVVPVSPTRDTIGLIARDVPVVAALDAQITGEPRSEPLTSLVGLRLGAPRHPFRDGMAPELQDAFDERLAELRAAGCTVVEAELPDGVADAVAPCGMAIALYETPGALDDYLAAHGSPVRFADVVQGIASPDVAAVLGPLVSEPVPEEAYRQAIDVDRPALRQALLDYFAEHRLDAVVTPTAPLTAPVLRDGGLISFAGNDEPAFPVLVRNSDLWATVGWPAVSVPAFRDRAGLPFGIDLQGLEGHDTDLLAAAHGCLQVWQDGADDGAR